MKTLWYIVAGLNFGAGILSIVSDNTPLTMGHVAMAIAALAMVKVYDLEEIINR